MTFDFSAPARLLFGIDRSREITPHASTMGSCVCLVTGSKPQLLDWLTAQLQEANLNPLTLTVANEPTIEFVAVCADRARQHGCDVVVAIGGGAVLDTGKALAALITNHGEILDYLEVVGQGMPLTQEPAPLIAVPTTAGTGAEATANAVLGVTDAQGMGVKVSLRSRLMLPDMAIVDPQLTATMPPSITAATGMDALTQLIEAFVSLQSNPLTDALCREGLRRAAKSLRRAYDDGSDMDARTDMALASHFSGMALANAKLGAVHGFAAPLGGRFHAPHGAVCAALLPHVMEMNLYVLGNRGGNEAALGRYDETARMLTGSTQATAVSGVAWVQELAAHMHLPGLASMGVTPGDFDELARQAAKASSMKGNPISLTHEELVEILRRAQ